MTKLVDIDLLAADAVNGADMAGETGNIAQTCPKLTLEVGVFFDGTLNNRFNVALRNRSDDSYHNALSNPALLWARYKNGATHDVRNSCGGTARAFRSIYVEGPGSVAGEADDSMGYATGMGRRSGVEARVLSGFERLLREIGLAGGPPSIEKVVLDVFGFSRGAAAARYFVNCIRARRIRYDPVGRGDFTERLPEGLTVEIRFLGIFDTVAAIGNAGNDNNDPVNVHLKTAQVTGRIYHLVADDEYRVNFRLNRNWPGGGDHQLLPGAHSDVGGGYRDPGDAAQFSGVSRRSWASRALAEADQAAKRRADMAPGAHRDAEAVFVAEGWLNANETEGGIMRQMTPIREGLAPAGMRGGVMRVYSYDEQLVLNRPWVQVGLSRVALHMMHEAAQQHVNGAFLPLPTNDANYVIPAGLRPYEAEIRSGSLAGARRRAVLRGFGHVSMKDGSLLTKEWWGHRPSPGHVRGEAPNEPGKAI
ncbi:T6SS phospholipase effector Tle1-like catalytic domain-containing protein [Paracoccus xiamenensis]|uniref:T6SS phospholipase effector Tle1-like catalytic domain-containing protein n=1 Tax=Paracoccus xiamenensis TaxID=2714901 RepID=UPI00140901B1|nr:DUF2235 domain-containing protein [Paracoccus xiamenensis]NHF74317.1 DUF2235 domain-containing protein [Paracoccus xiamenensis]